MRRSSLSPSEPTRLESAAESAEFCVVCGTTGAPLVEGLCSNCAAERLTLVSATEHAVVTICPTCGARKIGHHWERSGSAPQLSNEDLVPLLTFHSEVGLRKAEWVETGRNPLVRELSGQLRIRFRGMERTEPLRLQVQIVHRTCSECSRKSGHFYTARLQLRGPESLADRGRRGRNARLWELWESLLPEARADWANALGWREELPEGWDLFFIDTLAARSMARLAQHRWDAELKETATLWGRRDGADVYRVTLCVRVPAERLGRRTARPTTPDAPTSPPPRKRRSGRARARVER